MTARDLPAAIETRLTARAQQPEFLRHADAVRAIRVVLDLHRPTPGPDDDGAEVCWKCRGRGDDFPDEWPCETVRAIGAALTVGAE